MLYDRLKTYRFAVLIPDNTPGSIDGAQMAEEFIELSIRSLRVQADRLAM